MSRLFSPYTLGELQLSNRIVIPPMCQYSATNGAASDWHIMHLGSLAMSGAGLLIIEATAVEPIGRISAADIGLWSDATETALARVLQAIRSYSAIPIGIQLAHAGRKASTAVPWEGGQLVHKNQGGWTPVAPSSLAYSPEDPAPEALDETGLQRILTAFVSAAKRAQGLNIDLIELHAAHGYLLHEFLSPLSNTRNDKYGGSLENRMRFPLAVFRAMREAVDERIPIGVRISAMDWIDDGWDLEQSIIFTQALQKLGCSFIHVSSGGLSPRQHIPIAPGYQLPLAESIRMETGMSTVGVGLITEPEQAESVIAEGRADLVAIGRGMLYNPRWPWHAAARLGAEVDAPPQYWRCQPHSLKTLFGAVHFRQR
jgi:2,4-dienoyl-CoA reductase-like NADH-dependent reductase (Old Yellow Enzyme family)